ncbi:MAG: PKD domain-containing protein, partial [Ginsengibacter sp.]
MKPLLVLCLFVFGLTSFTGLSAQSPVANAGPDQTIYLTQTNSVTLNGSSSFGDSYQWTEVSTDYKSGATITSPNSAVTTVTGLPQGVFYFQLAVTSGGSTATDVVVVSVDYATPPNGQILRNLPFSSINPIVNDRHDTTDYLETEWYNSSNGQSIFFDRCRLPGQYIDPQMNKFYSIIEDGYGWNGNDYARSEMSFGNYYNFDTAKTYCMEWKGYFPQDWSYLALNQSVGIFMQIHANSDDQHMLGTQVINTGSGPKFVIDDNGQYTVLADLNTFVNQTHTIRVIFREGTATNGAYYKVEIDGVQKYLKNTGTIGGLPAGQDYPKIATLYDYGRAIVDPSNTTRGRKFSMVTEQFNVYLLNDAQTATPTADAGSNQTITLPTNSINLSGSGSVSGGTIQSYNWTKSSGPSGATITSPNSQSTSVTNLVQGTYVFQLKVTDNNGATATSTVQVTVNAQPQNAIPKASAGADQTITLPTNTVNLTGSGSDSDGTITAYLWTKTIGPSGGNIVSPTLASTSISNLQQGEYTFELKVTDNAGATGIDTVHVTVNAAANQSPVADAGIDQNIVLPINTADLSGKGTDVDGSIISYQWAEVSGNTCTISNSNSSNATVNGLTEGSYQFELTVTDNQGAIGKDTMLVSVKAGANIIPTATAGADQTITLPTNSVHLKGGGVDTDGTITSYLWTKISGSTATITKASSATTNVTGLVQGTYQFELQVTDDKGAIAKDTVQITVNSDANIAPTANAGADQTITLPTNPVTLNGSGTDSDGTIASYSWTKTAGPSAGTISNASSATTTITSLIAGEYTFNLKVTDNQGATGADTVHVTVKNDTTTTTQVAKQNIAPTANAGTDQTITLPTNTVTLNGSGTDSDGTIASYSWTKTAGPSAGTISNASSATTTITSLIAGEYTFNLKVT